MKRPTWCIGFVLASATALAAESERQATNPRLAGLAPNRWGQLHVQQPGDKNCFRRQGHGGSCFDTKRGRLILFGSDTHGSNWENSPLVLDPRMATWSPLYPFDPPETYHVTEAGIPVAGTRGEHPWAMHTFGTVIYDPLRDEMVVACYPAHMVPGRFTNALAEVWPKARQHPTWTFDLASQRWRPLECEPVHFFPYCAAYDSDRNVVLGHRPEGIYELSGEPRQWKRLTEEVFLRGWHTNCAYDARHKALVVFGHNENRNDIEVFFPATGEHRLMPTPGKRPPKDQHNPMEFNPVIGKTVVIVDRNAEDGSRSVAETWLYDLGKDSWSQVSTAMLPFACGMNYNLEYDPTHECLLLVTGGYAQPTAVWALKILLK
jgi:hypothetical protein